MSEMGQDLPQLFQIRIREGVGRGAEFAGDEDVAGGVAHVGEFGFAEAVEHVGDGVARAAAAHDDGLGRIDRDALFVEQAKKQAVGGQSRVEEFVVLRGGG